MNEEANRLKRDLQTIENALGVNLWTRRDVRRGLMGVLGGGLGGLFLAIWSACDGSPVIGLLVLLTILAAIVIGKGIGFERQPARAPGSVREIAFYNRFYAIGSILVSCFYLWGQARGMDPLTAFGLAVAVAGVWYLFYAISAPSRWISLGGAIPLTAAGFLLADAPGFSDALCRLGLAMCAGCCAEGVLLYIALRSPPAPSSDNGPARGNPATGPDSPKPILPLQNAAH